MDQGIDAELQNGEGSARESPPPPRRTAPHALDYIFLMRPMILIPVWTFFLLGAYHGSAVATGPVRVSHLLAGLFARLGGHEQGNSRAHKATKQKAEEKASTPISFVVHIFSFHDLYRFEK